MINFSKLRATLFVEYSIIYFISMIMIRFNQLKYIMNNVIDKTFSFLLSGFYVRVQNERKTQEVEKFTTITVLNITKIDAHFCIL